MDNQSFELLDILSIISFAMQVQNTQQLAHQATNDDVIASIHGDIEEVNQKLDLLIGIVSRSSTDAGMHPSSAQSTEESSKGQ